jgi:hypothetical protein
MPLQEMPFLWGATSQQEQDLMRAPMQPLHLMMLLLQPLRLLSLLLQPLHLCLL